MGHRSHLLQVDQMLLMLGVTDEFERRDRVRSDHVHATANHTVGARACSQAGR